MRDDPSLRGKALAVGGSPDKRGVVATCSYEARAYGVRSAMAMRTALKLCPDLLVVRPRFDVYRAVSKQIHAIFRDYTDLIEPLSLDEAYLDVSASPHFAGSATRIAQDIRRRVAEELHITVSAGVAPNKFLAKIASDWRKPDGLFVITPEQVDGFVAELPVAKLHGVGKVTAERLARMGIRTCADLRQGSKLSLVREFGSFGERLWGLAHGIDERPVEVDSRRQSVSVECTFDRDLPDLAACLEELPTLLEELDGRLQRLDGSYRPDKPFVKLKFHDFHPDHGGTVRRRARPGELPAIARPGLCPWQSSGAPDRRWRAPARPAGRPRTTQAVLMLLMASTKSRGSAATALPLPAGR